MSTTDKKVSRGKKTGGDSKSSKSKKGSKHDESKKNESIQNSEEEEETPEYEVEEIIEKKIKWGTIYYRVKWKGFSLDDTTWEPESNLGNAPLKIRAYENQLLEKAKETGEAPTKDKASKAKADKPTSLSSPLEPDSVTGKRTRDKLDDPKAKEEDKENKNKNKKSKGKKKGSMDEDQESEAGSEDKPAASTKKTESSNAKAKPAEERTSPSEDKNKAIEEEKTKEKEKSIGMEEEKSAAEEKLNKSGSKDDQSASKQNKTSTQDKKSASKDDKGGSLPTTVQKPSLFSLLQPDPSEKKDVGSQNIVDAAQLNKLCQQVLTPNNTNDSTTAKNGQAQVNQPIPLKAAANANQNSTSGKDTPKDTTQNSATKDVKTDASRKEEGLTLSKIMQDDKLMELSENEDSGKNGAQKNKTKAVTPTSNHQGEGQPSTTKTKRKGKNENGSFEKGDTPVKVIGIRPVREVNDLEVMIAWKNRDDGSKPYNSKVMRLELLRRGHWRPLLEFYESKMKLESAPSFDPTSLSKLNN